MQQNYTKADMETQAGFHDGVKRKPHVPDVLTCRHCGYRAGRQQWPKSKHTLTGYSPWCPTCHPLLSGKPARPERKRVDSAPPDGYIGASEAARRLGLTYEVFSTYRYRRNARMHEIPTEKVGRQVYFDARFVDMLVAQRNFASGRPADSPAPMKQEAGFK